MASINWTEVQTLGGILVAGNTAADGYFWIGMLMLLFFVLLLLFIRYGFEVAVMGSGGISFIAGLFLAYSDLINWTWCLFFFAIVLLTILYTMYRRND